MYHGSKNAHHIFLSVATHLRVSLSLFLCIESGPELLAPLVKMGKNVFMLNYLSITLKI